MANTLEEIRKHLSSSEEKAESIKETLDDYIKKLKASSNDDSSDETVQNLGTALMYVNHSLETLSNVDDELDNQVDESRIDEWVDAVIKPKLNEADEFISRSFAIFDNVINQENENVTDDAESEASATTTQSVGGGSLGSDNLTQDEIDSIVRDMTNKDDQVSENEILGSEEESNEDLQDTEATVDQEQENVNQEQESASVEGDDASNSLTGKFTKYFTNTPANTLRSIDFGKHLWRYFETDKEKELPKDPAALLNATRVFFEDDKVTDEGLVRLVIDKVKHDHGSLLTFDMVADLVESDAYQNFGKTSSKDQRSKLKFERWLRKDSLLSKLDSCTSTDIVLEEEGLRRVIDAIVPEQEQEKYLTVIDEKIAEFDKDYAQKLKNNKEDSLTQLKEIAVGQGSGGLRATALQKVGEVYHVLCSLDKVQTINEQIYTTMAGVPDFQSKNVIASGWVHNTNKTLFALQKRGKITEQEFDQITIEELPHQTQTQKKRVHPIRDVVNTFCLTAGGATVISALSSINPAFGVALGVVGVIGAGFATASNEKKKLRENNVELTASQIKEIARKSGVAMVKKAIPFFAAVTLGPAGRVFGAVTVAAKTFIDDIEYRAGLQRDAFEQQQAEEQKEELKGIKGFFKKVKNNIKKVGQDIKQVGRNMKEVGIKGNLKSFGYAAAKGAAVFVGGTVGAKFGSSLGNKLFFGSKEPTIQGLNDKFTELRGQETQNVTTEGVVDVKSELTAENLEALDSMDNIELTENARATAYEANNRQYVDGVQQDWYNAQEQANAVRVLEEHGVEDPMGVLRKLGSMARFNGGEFQDTLDNLTSGHINNNDVQNIIESLNSIDETGDLISNHSGNTVSTDNEISGPSNPPISGEISDGENSLPAEKDVVAQINPKIIGEIGGDENPLPTNEVVTSNKSTLSGKISGPSNPPISGEISDGENSLPAEKDVVAPNNPKIIGEIGGDEKSLPTNEVVTSNKSTLPGEISGSNNPSISGVIGGDATVTDDGTDQKPVFENKLSQTRYDKLMGYRESVDKNLDDYFNKNFEGKNEQFAEKFRNNSNSFQEQSFSAIDEQIKDFAKDGNFTKREYNIIENRIENFEKSHKNSINNWAGATPKIGEKSDAKLTTINESYSIKNGIITDHQRSEDVIDLSQNPEHSL